MNGLLLVDKPKGITSFDVIRQLRRITGYKKIGHAGTLDPLASGLMLLLFGTATKQAAHFSKLDKRYLATVRFGAVSTTGDEEGEKIPVSDRVPDESELLEGLRRLTGQIEQIPSAYSAIKIDGQEAYKRIRRGEKVDMPSRTVQVYEAKLSSYNYPVAAVEWHVSSGTYIRTLAEDLGKILGSGAYLTGLIRTEVGEFKLEQAVGLDNESVKFAVNLLDCSQFVR
jgi:tRNA pseudouridine55 synthase